MDFDIGGFCIYGRKMWGVYLFRYSNYDGSFEGWLFRLSHFEGMAGFNWDFLFLNGLYRYIKERER
ncbi:MAG: hypothetical protein JW885_02660 [Deltaproteobacteria bacterium]|nr:hypothetical protein [Candidatus Zymogenaceae bacterium]